MRYIVAFILCSFLLNSNTAFAQTTPKDIPLEEFGALEKNSQVSLSPDGKHFAILSFIQGTKYLVITPFGGKPLPAIPPYKGMEFNQI